LPKAICKSLNGNKQMHQRKRLTHKETKDTVSKASTGKRASRHQTPWEIASKLVAGVPEEAWTALPSDLSVNIDHYLYGVPKQEKP